MKYLLTLTFIIFSFSVLAQIDTTETVYIIIDEMPTLASCDNIENYELKKSTSDKMVLEHIYKNLKLPKTEELDECCLRYGIQFIVEKDGSISNIKIRQNCICNDAMIEIIQSLPKFSCGKLRGEPVRVQVSLSIRLRIDY